MRTDLYSYLYSTCINKNNVTDIHIKIDVARLAETRAVLWMLL